MGRISHVTRIPGELHFQILALSLLLSLIQIAATAFAEEQAVRMGDAGELVYHRDDQGNRIPHFSHAGYAGGERDIPNVPASIVVKPTNGDDGARIQAAIDHVANLPIDDRGFRGAVLLAPGRFEVAGQLRITAPGIVLRGSGATDEGTTVVATGQDRRALIRVEGVANRELLTSKDTPVVDEYVPVGATELTVDSASSFEVGDTVLVSRPSTAAWVKAIGADTFGIGWRPGTRDVRWDRVIVAIDGSTITVDAPITTALEQQFGGGRMQAYDWPGRIAEIGIEDLRLESGYAEGKPYDEDHCWFGVTMQHCQNAWVRRVEFRHFAGGAVLLLENAKGVTVEDCASFEPISENGGYRRHTFFTQGQLTLFLRCWSEQGRRDFAVGHCAAGPNAFVNCFAAEALSDSGPLESWASGVLYDNVRIDGGGLHLMNRWVSPPAAGWAAANSVLWHCRSSTMHCAKPPTANNWSIGCWSNFAGDGSYESRTNFVKPLSLYQAQLAERVGEKAAQRVDPLLLQVEGATNPSLEQAAKFVARSDEPARQLIDVIRENFESASQRIRAATPQAPAVEDILATSATQVVPQDEPQTLVSENGWLVINGKLKTGNILNPMWWRGNLRPDETPAFGPSITRFAPGRVSVGMTDELEEVAEQMLDNRIAVYDHHYGLWYDRRRDTHLMVRQENGDVTPPFYEQPFVRSGQGTAWDGLSKYVLTNFNPWYWNRLRDFAQLCEQQGLVLFHQNYFQHNILEAGAHWADSPWRSANNINDTGFPEPPPYISDKRIFQAHLFYDVTHEQRRRLHRTYIRQCLDNFVDCPNVIQMTSSEYSGPLEFTKFWVDTIVEWEKEQNRNVLLGLSCPKDVQDAILDDPERSLHIDVIDIRYWHHSTDGRTYAPEGGKNLAPRQHRRQSRVGGGDFGSVVRSVREYRQRFPDKAVTFYADLHSGIHRDGWAVLIGGGSLPNVQIPGKLAKAIPGMKPVDGVVEAPGQWCLSDGRQHFLFYVEETSQPLSPNLDAADDTFLAIWIDSKTGEIIAEETLESGGVRNIRCQSNVLWLQRQN